MEKLHIFMQLIINKFQHIKNANIKYNRVLKKNIYKNEEYRH